MSRKNTKQKPAPRKRTPWNAREILFAVTGYLTTRDSTLIFDRHHDCAPLAEILGKIADANGLPACRDKYQKIKIPDGIGHITNIPLSSLSATVKQAALPPATEPVTVCLNVIRSKPWEEQNDILRLIIKGMQDDRAGRISMQEGYRKEISAQLDHAHKINEDFLSIAKS